MSPPPDPSASSSRNIRLDGVKGILELLIVLEHNALVVHLSSGLKPLVASFCVGCFMLLTFTREVEPLPFCKYIDKHYRYFVPYLAFFTASSILNFMIFRPGSLLNFCGTYLMGLLWQSPHYIKEASGFAFLWFLPALCVIYLLRYIHSRLGTPFLVVAAIAHCTIGLIPADTLYQAPMSMHPAIYLFVLGVLYGKIHRRFVDNNLYAGISFAVFIALVLVNPVIPWGLLLFAGKIPSVLDPIQFLYYDLILLASFPGLYFATKYLPKLLLRPLAFCGRNSLWIYLSHQMFYVALTRFVHAVENGWVLYGITVVLSCVVSFIISKFATVRRIVIPYQVSDLPKNLSAGLRRVRILLLRNHLASSID